MFIIYNQDGSVKETNFTEFIQKGNNRAEPNNIYVRVNGWNAADYGAYAVFKLPNDQATVIIGELVEDYEETIYTDENGNPVKRAFLGYGYLITLTQDVTCFAGIVKCTIKVTDGEEENPEILYTYPVDLTINDTAIAPEDLTLANLSQYNNLKRYLDGQLDNLEEELQTTKIYKHSILLTKNNVGYKIQLITKDSQTYDALTFKGTVLQMEAFMNKIIESSPDYEQRGANSNGFAWINYSGTYFYIAFSLFEYNNGTITRKVYDLNTDFTRDTVTEL